MARRALLLALFLVGLSAVPASAAVTVSDPRQTETGDLVFTVQLTGLDVTGQAQTQDGTATAGQDYVSRSQPVAQPQTQVTVDVTDLDVPERDETVLLRVTTNTGATATGTGVIVDDDPTPLGIADASAAEGAGFVDVPVSVTPIDREVSVAYATAPGTATAGEDFTPVSGRVAVAPGQSSAAIRVPIVADDADEADEAFTITLDAPQGDVAPVDTQATVTIANDDLRAVSLGDATVTEADAENVIARIPVVLSAPTFRTVTVAYGTLDGSARAPLDYLGKLGAVTFAPGETAAFIEIAVSGDRVREGREVFGVLTGAITGARAARGSGLVTVLDDDGPEGDDVAPNMRVTSLRRIGRTVAVRVGCPRNETRCVGRVTFFSSADRRSRARLRRRERRLGRRSFSLRGGQARTVRMALSRTTLAAARRARRLRLAAFVVTQDANRNTDTKASSATLRFRR